MECGVARDAIEQIWFTEMIDEFGEFQNIRYKLNGLVIFVNWFWVTVAVTTEHSGYISLQCPFVFLSIYSDYC